MTKPFLSLLLYILLTILAACSAPSFMTTTATHSADPKQSDILIGNETSGQFLIAHTAQQNFDLDTACQSYLQMLNGSSPPSPYVLRQAIPTLLACGNIRQGIIASQSLQKEPHELSLFAPLAIMTNGLANKKPIVIQESLSAPYPALLANRIAAYWNYQALPQNTHNKDAILQLSQPLYKTDNIIQYTEIVIIYAELFQRGLVLAHQGLYKDAIAIWTPLYQNLQTNSASRLLWLMIHAYSLNGEHEAALTLIADYPSRDPLIDKLQKSLAAQKKLPPIFNDPQQNLSEALFFISHLVEQNSSMDALIFLSLAERASHNPDFSRYALAKSNILAAANKTLIALRILEKIQPRTTYYLEAMKRKAQLLFLLEETDQAIRLLSSLLDEFPHDDSLLLITADLLRFNQEYEKAISLYNQLIKRIDHDPQAEHWKYYFRRGIALEQYGNWPDAERDMITAIGLTPDQASVLNYLGYSWIDRKINLQRGKELLEQALSLNRNDAAIIDSVGWAHYHLGEYQQAVEYLEEAVQSLPLDPIVNDHLGDAYWNVGRKKEAFFQWRRALQMSPDQQHTSELLHKTIHGID